MALIQSLISKEKYGIKCPYEMNPVGICIHNTYNDASAKNEITYMKSNNNQVSFHVAIDDSESIQGIPFNRNAWHAGDGGRGEGNRKYISIEICYSKSGGTRFEKAEQRAAEEVAVLLKKYGWGIDKVKAHRDFSGKNCPHRTNMDKFKMMVKKELSKISDPNESENNTSDELYRVRKTWDCPSSQKGAFKNLNNAKECARDNEEYKVFDSKGNQVYPEAIKDITIQVGSKVKVTGIHYATGQKIPSWVKKNSYTVMETNGEKALLKEIMSWVYVRDLILM